MTRRYTPEELERAMEVLRSMFDIVRVVEPMDTDEVCRNAPVPPDETDAKPSCFALWGERKERCLNCIGLRAIQERERQTKYEFVHKDIFYVVAIPIEVNRHVLAMELISRVNDRVLLSAYGTNEFVSRVTAFNAQLHTDESTGLFNRRYLDEKLFLLCSKALLNKTDVAVALLSVDGFEHVASHFGCHVADEAIIAIGRLLNANVSHRRGDFVARYGSNTFAIVFDNIPPVLLHERLTALTQRVSTLRLIGYEDVRLNIAMGVFQLSENRDASITEIGQVASRRLEIARAAGFNRIAFADR